MANFTGLRLYGWFLTLRMVFGLYGWFWTLRMVLDFTVGFGWTLRMVLGLYVWFLTLRMVLAKIAWRPVEIDGEQISMIKITDLRLCGWF